jgi:hypothetical protein
MSKEEVDRCDECGAPAKVCAETTAALFTYVPDYWASGLCCCCAFNICASCFIPLRHRIFLDLLGYRSTGLCVDCEIAFNLIYGDPNWRKELCNIRKRPGRAYRNVRCRFTSEEELATSLRPSIRRYYLYYREHDAMEMAKYRTTPVRRRRSRSYDIHRIEEGDYAPGAVRAIPAVENARIRDENLTVSQANRIRQLFYRQGAARKELADRFRCSRRAISDILNYERLVSVKAEHTPFLL